MTREPDAPEPRHVKPDAARSRTCIRAALLAHASAPVLELPASACK